jgi:hypothetical protein
VTTTTKRFDVRSPEGTLMFSVHLMDESTAIKNGQAPSAQSNQSSAGESPKRSDAQRDSGAMTQSQERYLFRILADRGVEGDAAHEELIDRFGVQSLATVSKEEASSMIKRLLQESETA